MALASLTMRKKVSTLHTPKLIIRLCEAKFDAETANGVGRDTTVIVMNHVGNQANIGSGDLEKIRSNWEAVRKQPPPQDIAKNSEKDIRESGHPVIGIVKRKGFSDGIPGVTGEGRREREIHMCEGQKRKAGKGSPEAAKS